MSPAGSVVPSCRRVGWLATKAVQVTPVCALAVPTIINSPASTNNILRKSAISFSLKLSCVNRSKFSFNLSLKLQQKSCCTTGELLRVGRSKPGTLEWEPGRTNYPPMSQSNLDLGRIFCTLQLKPTGSISKFRAGQDRRRLLLAKKSNVVNKILLLLTPILRCNAPSSALSPSTIPVSNCNCQCFQEWIEKFSLNCHSYCITDYPAGPNRKTEICSGCGTPWNRDIDLVKTNESRS